MAPEGWYAILKNPAKDGTQPRSGSNESISLEKLDVGRKVHMPGPTAFALWPGQMAQVVEGHKLRSNQYLIVRVYDADAAQENWGKTIIQTVSSTSVELNDKPEKDIDDVEKQEIDTKHHESSSILDDVISFSIGKLMIVKGTDVSFFIPPTGVEVVKDHNGKYIREAVTLERLIYCVLLDESGSKRYVRGPAVVFPRPTEVFQTQTINGKVTRRFRAIELNTTSGIYIKVIAPYEEKGIKYNEGQELFITGKEQSIYYRRDEHQIIRYGDKEIHYATAIPKGEARYVLNRLTGEVDTIYGPKMFLPNPITEVLIRRNIPLDLVKLMYPGNAEAIEYNEKLKSLGGSVSDFVTDNAYASSQSDAPMATSFRSTEKAAASYETLLEKVAHTADGRKVKFASATLGDPGFLDKSTAYTKPRTVTLDSKYDGAVRIKVWTGYAVMIVDGVGKRKIIEGPAMYNMAYDEYPEIISLSTGKPKTTDTLIKDIYLRTKNNKVSDIVTVETKDLVGVTIKLSYRLDFINENNIWFNVENYVKFLCDHMRSRLKGNIQTRSISDFYADSVKIIRDIILGEKISNKKRGYLFEANNMFISDVEILQVAISDSHIANNILETQQEIVTTTIGMARKQELLELRKRDAAIKKEINAIELDIIKDAAILEKSKDVINTETRKRRHVQTELAVMQDAEIKKLQLNNEIEAKQQINTAEVKAQEFFNAINDAELIRTKKSNEEELNKKRQLATIANTELNAQSAAVVSQLEAITPGLVEALTTYGQLAIISDIMPSSIPLSIVEGKSVGATLTQLFDGTPVGKVLDNATKQISGKSIEKE